MKSLLPFFLLAPCCAGLGLAGDFVNLTFDEPDVSHLQYDPWRGHEAAPIGELLRGWSSSTGLEGAPYFGLLSLARGAAPFSLMASPEPEGKPYYLHLHTDWFPHYPPAYDRPTVRLWQEGTIPAKAIELRVYDSKYDELPGPDIELRLNGALQPFTKSYYGNKAISVEAFAGQEVTLELVFPGGRGYNFDIYGFTLIPEPSTWALLALGGGVVWWRLWLRPSERG